MGRRPTRIVIAILLLSGGCTRSQAREYELRGQVLRIDAGRQEVTIKHEDIPRFMPAMTMTFRVADKGLLAGRVAGDLVNATLVIRDSDVHLRSLDRTGHAPISDAPSLPTVVLARGEQVADATFIDERGASRRLSEWRGSALAVTFIYTRCPVPTFCPLMDRHFKSVHDRIRSDAALARTVRLVSVSFDPRHDTPSVLSQHATKLQADPAIWRFLTGDEEELAKFAKQFGVSIMRENGNDEIVHNLRTAVIDPDGRLVTILNGSEWTPSQLLTDLTDASAEDSSR